MELFNHLSSPSLRSECDDTLQLSGFRTKQLIESAEFIAAALWNEQAAPSRSEPYTSVAWLHWRAIQAMAENVSDKALVGAIYEALLSGIDDWIGAMSSVQAAGLAEGMKSLLEKLASAYGIVSRGAVGAIIFLEKSGRTVRGLLGSMSSCKFSYDDLLAACAELKEIRPRCFLGGLESSAAFYDNAPDERQVGLDPVAGLLWPIEYLEFLATTTWGGMHYGMYEVGAPFGIPPLRSLNQIGKRLSYSNRRQILEELRA